MSGWISISRGIFSHDFFPREPFSEREAFIWMIANAAWKDTRHRIGTEMVDVPRGSFFCTLRGLQSAWMWRSDTKVRTFLKRTQAERMIVTKNNAKKTHVTICNYDIYQVGERTENAQKTQAAPKKKRTENALKEQVNNKQQTKEDTFVRDFDILWGSYPKKEGKKPALASYIKARRKVEADEISKPLGQYIKSKNGTDMQFYLHLSTWLNQERWNDVLQSKEAKKWSHL